MGRSPQAESHTTGGQLVSQRAGRLVSFEDFPPLGRTWGEPKSFDYDGPVRQGYFQLGGSFGAPIPRSAGGYFGFQV